MTVKQYKFLGKKRTELALVFTSNGFFCVLVSNRERRKMLRDKKVFVGKVRVRDRDWDDNYKIELIREWWESTDDESLIERLNTAPRNSNVILNFDNKLRIFFSDIDKNELAVWMFTNPEELPPEQDD